MYGKYDETRVKGDLEKFKKIHKAYLDDGSINPDFLSTAYNSFMDNVEKLKNVFPYRRIHVTEVAMAPYEEVWTWDSQEELDRTKKEILKLGLYLPIIVLEKGIVHRDRAAGPNKYHVLDGNHRVDAILRLFNEGKVDGVIDAFIFPEYCIEVRAKMKLEYQGEKYNHSEEVEINIMSHSVSKLKIKRFFFANFKKTIETVKVKNKLEIYNCVLSIGHEITPLMYMYYLDNYDYPDGVKDRMIKVS